MIFYHKRLTIEPKELSFKKRINYSKTISFVPMKYNKQDIIIQTPSMYVPFSVSNYDEKNTKQYLVLSFLLDNQDTHGFLNNLETIVSSVRDKYSSNYSVPHFIKHNDFSQWMRLKVSDRCLFFNDRKERISEFNPKTHGTFIIQLSGLWIIDNTILFQWILLQAKIFTPIEFIKYMFIDEHKTKIPPPPPLPPPPKIKQYIPQKKKVIKKPKLTDDSFSPSLNEIQIALVALKKHNC